MTSRASRGNSQRETKTTWSQYQVMVAFIEIPYNFNLLNDKGTYNLKGKGVVAEAKLATPI